MSGNYYKLENLTVLLVDDRRSMRSFIADVLREIGIGKVLNAESYQEATKLIDPPAAIEGLDFEMPPLADIVVIDWLLGDGESGLDLLRWIRQHQSESVKYLPVIMLSGYSERDNIILARDQGANEFLAKPISITRLLERLLSVVERPRPFVKATAYFGPDRRRSNIPVDHPDRRQQKHQTGDA